MNNVGRFMGLGYLVPPSAKLCALLRSALTSLPILSGSAELESPVLRTGLTISPLALRIEAPVRDSAFNVIGSPSMVILVFNKALLAALSS